MVPGLTYIKCCKFFSEEIQWIVYTCNYVRYNKELVKELLFRALIL